MIRTALFILVLVHTAAYGKSPDANTEKTLERYRSLYVEGIRDEDVAKVTRYYDDQVRLMPEANPTVLSADHARQYFAALFARFDVKDYERHHRETLDMGAQLAEFGTFTLHMTDSQREKRVLEGKYLHLWKRERDGSLSLVTDSWNFNDWKHHNADLLFEDVPSTVMAFEEGLGADSPVHMELLAYGLLIPRAVVTKDVKSLILINSEDTVLYPNYGSIIQGREEVEKYWGTHIGELPAFQLLRNRMDKVEDLGEYVLHYSSHIAVWHSGVNTGKHLRIWKRDEGGTLRCFRRISTYDK